jgi:hypothetical protein
VGEKEPPTIKLINGKVQDQHVEKEGRNELEEWEKIKKKERRTDIGEERAEVFDKVGNGKRNRQSQEKCIRPGAHCQLR